jgi:hypothetical protein
MKPRSARGLAVGGVALLTVVLIAACGGGGSSNPSSTTSSNSAAAKAPAAAGGLAARFAKEATCLKKYGVTLPSLGGRRFGATGGAGFAGGRFGATGGAGFAGGRFGATGRFGGPGGFRGATGGRGVFGGAGGAGRGVGGFLGGNSKFAQAAKKCGLTGGAGFAGGRFGATGARGAPTPLSAADRAEVTKFISCMSTNGVKLPAPNLTGRGSVFNVANVNTHSTAFTTAEAKCRSIITFVPTAGGAPPPG